MKKKSQFDAKNHTYIVELEMKIMIRKSQFDSKKININENWDI